MAGCTVFRRSSSWVLDGAGAPRGRSGGYPSPLVLTHRLASPAMGYGALARGLRGGRGLGDGGADDGKGALNNGVVFG